VLLWNRTFVKVMLVVSVDDTAPALVYARLLLNVESRINAPD